MFGGCTDDSTIIPPDDTEISSTFPTLKWDIPVARADGEPLPLSEIGGYMVYYSTHEYGWYTLLADMDEPSFRLDALVNGTYYFYVTTYDTAYDESAASNIITVLIEE